MTKQHPFDDFHQRIHWSGTSIGTVTQQWGNPAPQRPKGITDPHDGLGNTTPHIVYEFE